MGKPTDPGPPLLMEQEFCASEPPGFRNYARAGLAALGVMAVGAGGWLAVVLATQRLWGVTMVLIGILAGWAVHQAAGKLRSLMLGLMAAGTCILAAALGYGLLWLPFVDPKAIDRQVSWFHFLMLAFGAFVAFRLAGPLASPRDHL